jgi:mannosyltransferase
LVAAGLMATRLASLSLWGDEGFTVQQIKLPWGAMLADLGRIDYNMALHYIALKGWATLWGTSEAATRSLSTVFAVAALPLVYRLVERLLGSRIALGSVILLGLNPFFIRLGVTARPFAMVLLWSVIATHVLLTALESRSRRWWLVYGLLAAVGVHVHMTAALAIAAHGLFALVTERRLTRFQVEAAAVFGLAGVVPTIIFMAGVDTLSWIPPFSAGYAARIAIAVAGGSLFAVFLLPLAAVGGLGPRERANHFRWLPLCWFAAPLGIMLALVPLQSIFVDWYFAVSVPALAILAATGIDRLLAGRPFPVLATATAVTGAALILTLAATPIGERQGWREVASMMSGRVGSTDAVAFPNAYYRIVAEYYAPVKGGSPYPPGRPALPEADWGTLTPYELDSISQSNHDFFEPLLLEWDRVWVVGVGSELDLAVEWDLTSHGYDEAEIISYDGVEARLYIRDS